MFEKKMTKNPFFNKSRPDHGMNYGKRGNHTTIMPWIMATMSRNTLCQETQPHAVVIAWSWRCFVMVMVWSRLHMAWQACSSNPGCKLQLRHLTIVNFLSWEVNWPKVCNHAHEGFTEVLINPKYPEVFMIQLMTKWKKWQNSGKCPTTGSQIPWTLVRVSTKKTFVIFIKFLRSFALTTFFYNNLSF